MLFVLELVHQSKMAARNDNVINILENHAAASKLTQGDTNLPAVFFFCSSAQIFQINCLATSDSKRASRVPAASSMYATSPQLFLKRRTAKRAQRSQNDPAADSCPYLSDR